MTDPTYLLLLYKGGFVGTRFSVCITDKEGLLYMILQLYMRPTLERGSLIYPSNALYQANCRMIMDSQNSFSLTKT